MSTKEEEREFWEQAKDAQELKAALESQERLACELATVTRELDELLRVCTEIAETTGYMHEGDGFTPQPCEPSQLPALMGRLRKERDEAHARGVAEGERLGAARALQEAADIWARSNGTLGLPDNRGVDGWLRFRAASLRKGRGT